jgi:hypothetical protein
MAGEASSSGAKVMAHRISFEAAGLNV